MTLILASSSQNYIYLSADTMVTSKKGDDIVGRKHDYFKIWWNSKGLYCAVAGDAELASYIIKRIVISRIDSKNFDYLKDNIELAAGKMCDEFWRTRRNGEPSSVTLLFASMENGTPRILSVEVRVRTNDIKIKEPSLGKRLVFGQIEPPIDEDLDSSEMTYSEMDDPGQMFGINAARINTLIGEHQLTGVGRYVTSLRIDASRTAKFSTGALMPIPTTNSTEKQIKLYSAGWDSDDAMPYILHSETGEKVELRSFMQSDQHKGDIRLLI